MKYQNQGPLLELKLRDLRVAALPLFVGLWTAPCFQDLLLTQQLSNMWVLPFYEENKRETCLSGFEKLTHEVRFFTSEFHTNTHCSLGQVENYWAKICLEALNSVRRMVYLCCRHQSLVLTQSVLSWKRKLSNALI